MDMQLKAKFKDDLILMRSSDYVTNVQVWLTQSEMIATLRLGVRETLDRNKGKLYFLLLNGSCIVFNKFIDGDNRLRNELDGFDISEDNFYSGRYKHFIITPFGVGKVLYNTKTIDWDIVDGLIEVDVNINSISLNHNSILIDDKNSNLLDSAYELLLDEDDRFENVDNFIDSYGSVKTYYDYDSMSGKLTFKNPNLEDLIEFGEPTKEYVKKNQGEEENKLFTI